MHIRLTPRDTLLAVLVAVAWGANFAVIRLGVSEMPPLLLASLRFVVVFAIAAPFVPRRGIPWRSLIPIGLAMGVGQFGFLFVAISLGMPSGLAATVLQVQVVFTTLFAVAFLGERLNGRRIVGLSLAVAGIVLIGLDAGASATLVGFGMTIAAAASWATSNVLTRKLGASNGLSLVVWTTAVPPIPLFLLSLTFEGPEAVGSALTHPTWGGAFTLAYLALFSTLFGYGVWNTLLAKYPASTVAPFSLLVPPVGLITGWLAFSEVPDVPSLIGAALVVAGIAVANIVVSRRRVAPRVAEERPERSAQPSA